MTTSTRSRCATGISGLDELLGGGLPLHRLYLLQGRPGVGKTTLALQFLFEGVRNGEKGLYITLSETRAELDAVAESHGWDLNEFDVLELSAVEEALGDTQENTFFQPSELELSKTAQVLLNEVERVKPARVVLDSLSEFRLLAEVPLRYRRQMLKLKQYFAGRQITVLLLDDLTGGDSDLHIQSIAHGVLTLDKLAQGYGVQRRQIQINKLRGVKFREGSHDYLIERGGLMVFPRLIAAEHRKGFKQEPVSSGIAEFDKLLGGGLDRGTSNLFIGPAGSGKSTVALHHAVRVADTGDKAIIFIFDENRKTLETRSKALGLDLEKHVREGRIHVMQVDPADLTPGQFAQKVRDAVEKDDVQLVMIDSLNGYLNSMPDERFLSLQLHELLSYLSQLGIVTIMTLAQHGIMGTMQTPVDVTYLSDTVVLFRYFEAIGEVRKAISVMKKRSGVHEPSIRELKMSARGLQVGEPLSGFQGILTGVPQIVRDVKS